MRPGAANVVVVAGVVGALAACRHEPTVGDTLQASMQSTANATSQSLTSGLSACVVTEGTADREARLVCQRQCTVERSLHAQTEALGNSFPRFDAGTLLGGGQSMAMVPELDGGARWLTLTTLADGGMRCEDRPGK